MTKAVKLRVEHGQLILGEHYQEPPKALWWAEDGQAKPCTVCKVPTPWRRPRARGAATHPHCEGSVLDTVTEDVLQDIVFTVAEAMGVTEVSQGHYTKPAVALDKRRLGNPHAGCEVCGRGYAGLWLVALVWRCADHDTNRVPAPKRHWHQ